MWPIREPPSWTRPTRPLRHAEVAGEAQRWIFCSRLGGAAAPPVGLLGGLWTALSKGANWRVAASPDGLRLRSGLVESRTQTVPPGPEPRDEVAPEEAVRPDDEVAIRLRHGDTPHDTSRSSVSARRRVP